MEESLPENLKSMIGNNIIKSYLKKFLGDNNGLGIGIFQSNKLLGFILFGNDKDVIKNLIKEDFYLILKSLFHQLFFSMLKR